MKKVKKMNIDGHMVIIHPSTDGGYVVRIPTLFGTVTQGETFKQAVAMAKDAIDCVNGGNSDRRIAVVSKVNGYLKREVLLGILKQAGISRKEFLRA